MALKIRFVIILAACFFLGLEARDEDKGNKKDEPPKIGNFALPTSQQPAPLLSFGQTLIGKGKVQFNWFEYSEHGNHKYYDEAIPLVYWGVTDELTVSFFAPFTVRHKELNHRAKGLEDYYIQAEQSVYTKSTKRYIDQATVVASLYFPTGSTKFDLPTGFGSYSFFLGGTLSRYYTDWFYYTSDGAVLTTSRHRTKFGNEYFYEFGFGRYLAFISDWLFVWMIECNGYYKEKDKIKGSIDMNTGGHSLNITPSIFISSEHIIYQLGFGFPLQESLNGDQIKERYHVAANVAWTF